MTSIICHGPETSRHTFATVESSDNAESMAERWSYLASCFMENDLAAVMGRKRSLPHRAEDQAK